MPNITLAPTLETMSKIYALSREGGPTSARFRAYVARVEHDWGLVAYNPMAGSAAAETVSHLLAIEAEAGAVRAAERAASACEFHEPMTLAIAVHSTGMWTDRVATEVDRRLGGAQSKPGAGIVSVWSREPVDIADIQRESVAETLRIMWAMRHGTAQRIETVLAREGLAYALARRLFDVELFGGSPTSTERATVTDALDVLRRSESQSDIASVLFGDGVAEAMGWTPLGIPAHAGYRWAIERAWRWIDDGGAARALRDGVSLADRHEG